MISCPQCKVEMKLLKEETHTVLRCDQCHGRSLKSATLEKFLGRDIAQDIMARARESGKPSQTQCPSCLTSTMEVSFIKKQVHPTLLVCPMCEFTWIPPDVYRLLPFLIPKHQR